MVLMVKIMSNITDSILQYYNLLLAQIGEVIGCHIVHCTDISKNIIRKNAMSLDCDIGNTMYVKIA